MNKYIKTYEGFGDLFPTWKDELKMPKHAVSIANGNTDPEESSEIEIMDIGETLDEKERTEKSISLAQKNSLPTYFNHITNTTEPTPKKPIN